MIRDFFTLADDASYDVIVAGAGAAGLAAALFAAIEGQRVLLVERTEYLGGTSALSAATIWIPGTPQGRSVNPDDTTETARRFLSAAVGNHSSAAMRDAFLEAGPKAVATLEANSELKFRPFATHPDYEQQYDGATMRGRAIEPLPFDGRALGDMVNRIRPPIPEFTIFGGMMVDRVDINHLLNIRSKLASATHAAKILARYGQDRIKGSKRGTRLLMGNALVGRFVKSLMDRDVDVLVETEITAFDRVAGRITGLTLTSKGETRKLNATKAVVLAGGGFGRHARRRDEMLSGPTPTHSPAAPGHTGALQDLAVALGARFGEGAADNAFWAPVSVRKRADGTTAVFPHFVLDRSKPGTVCVNQAGERFTNESNSYHLFARAMREAHKTTPTIPCFIVTDAEGLRTYGLGMVRMGTRNLAPYLADGYLTEGASLADLADKLGMKADALARSVASINSFAVTGIDPDFGRGTTGYHRHNGDATRGPNPTLGPIKTPPFYAVRLYPGDIGAATGLAISPDAQVLGAGDQPIQGLYACGNEAQSIMGGVYPGPGITLGPAITFAYRAIQHAVRGA
jgi:hypothetical protein